MDFVFHAQNRAEDIALVRDMGFEVDARLDVQWTNLCTKVVPNEKSFVDIFVHFFPRIFFEATIVNATSNKMLAANAVRTTFGELLRYIGTMLLISCYTKLPEYFWRTASRTGEAVRAAGSPCPGDRVRCAPTGGVICVSGLI